VSDAPGRAAAFGVNPPVVMGRVLAEFGVRGWVKLQPFTEQRDNLGQYRCWWLFVDGEWQTRTVAEWKPHGTQLVARFENCATREQAAAYRGCAIAVPREAMPEPAPGEFYRTDLVGLRVVNRNGVDLGRIAEVLENGAHPVLQVRWEGGERLLPLVQNVVEQVDLEAGEVRVDWSADW
jgi:16S rRNA processing protein RimM